MRNKLQSFAAVTAANAGFTAVAGPFGVDSPSDATRTSEKAACVRSYRNQKGICPKARIVLHHGKAWIIRKLPLELDNGRRNKQNVAGNFGICAGRMAGV
jgi:hypothetical protein